MDIGAHERVRRLLAMERTYITDPHTKQGRTEQGIARESTAASFRSNLLQELTPYHGRFQARIDEVFQLADHLAQKRTLTLLYRYRQAVQKLVEDLMQAFSVYEEQTLDRRGHMRRFRLARSIDKALEAVTRRVLDERASDLDVLQAIGALHGLLLDMLI
ncbi:MAG: DUF327 family protein [Candidatus Carbobacillus sp.]|nr:DUF327 family protein [Candidatus Carbobacillus sp.]